MFDMSRTLPWCKSCEQYAHFKWYYDVANDERTIIVKCEITEHSISIPTYRLFACGHTQDDVIDLLNEYSPSDIEWRKVER